MIRSIESFNRDYRRHSWREESSRYFNLLTATLNTNPVLSTDIESIPVINVTIMVGPLDVDHCLWALQGVTQTSMNPINRITLVTPAFQQNEVQKVAGLFARINQEYSNRVDVVSDEELLIGYPELEKLLISIRRDRKNWYKQQTLKWICAERGTLDNLIIDCELILLKSRLWVNGDGCQVHYLLNDLNPQYIVSCEKFLNTKLPKFDFVSHCALFQRDVLNDLTKGNMQEFICRWLKLGYKRYHPAPLCEWQTYANFIGSRYSGRVKIGLQKQSLVTDSAKLHLLNYQDLSVVFESWDAIYVSHKDRYHKGSKPTNN